LSKLPEWHTLWINFSTLPCILIKIRFTKSCVSCRKTWFRGNVCFLSQVFVACEFDNIFYRCVRRRSMMRYLKFSMLWRRWIHHTRLVRFACFVLYVHGDFHGLDWARFEFYLANWEREIGFFGNICFCVRSESAAELHRDGFACFLGEWSYWGIIIFVMTFRNFGTEKFHIYSYFFLWVSIFWKIHILTSKSTGTSCTLNDNWKIIRKKAKKKFWK